MQRTHNHYSCRRKASHCSCCKELWQNRTFHCRDEKSRSVSQSSEFLFDLVTTIVPSHCYDILGTINITENSSHLHARTISCWSQQPAVGTAANLTVGPASSPCYRHFQIQHHTVIPYKVTEISLGLTGHYNTCLFYSYPASVLSASKTRPAGFIRLNITKPARSNKQCNRTY